MFEMQMKNSESAPTCTGTLNRLKQEKWGNIDANKKNAMCTYFIAGIHDMNEGMKYVKV